MKDGIPPMGRVKGTEGREYDATSVHFLGRLTVEGGGANRQDKCKAPVQSIFTFAWSGASSSLGNNVGVECSYAVLLKLQSRFALVLLIFAAG
jgi:hypothetical protein